MHVEICWQYKITGEYSGPNAVQGCITMKIKKLGHVQIIAIFTLKNGTFWVSNAVMHQKPADEMAKNVDPDQTAPLALSVLILTFFMVHSGAVKRMGKSVIHL